MLVKFAGQVDDLQGTTTSKSAGRKPAGLRKAARDLLSRNPEGLKGRDVADFGLRIGGSAATRAKKHRRTQSQDDWGLPRSFRNYWRRHSCAEPARLLNLIYAAKLRLRAPSISSSTAVIFASGRNLTFKRSATSVMDLARGRDRQSVDNDGMDGALAQQIQRHCHVAMRRARAVYALRIFKPPRRPRATWSSPRRVARGVIWLT